MTPTLKRRCTVLCDLANDQAFIYAKISIAKKTKITSFRPESHSALARFQRFQVQQNQ
jgi:hypothetical protein